jgi:hypothetical protein
MRDWLLIPIIFLLIFVCVGFLAWASIWLVMTIASLLGISWIIVTIVIVIILIMTLVAVE